MRGIIKLKKVTHGKILQKGKPIYKIILPTKKQNVKKITLNLKRYIFYHNVVIMSTNIFVHCIDTFVLPYFKQPKYSTKHIAQSQYLCGLNFRQRKIACNSVLSQR